MRRSAGAPMGPPTISAEQPGSGSGGRLGLLRFNGAADDLGGTTKSCSAIQNKIFKLQWGRRRSRRNNAVMWATISCASPASMGPPTISAEQRFLSCLSATVHKRCFNGAADDLGGTTPSWPTPRRTAFGFNGAADDLGGTTWSWVPFLEEARRLQWGRRRSRRNNHTPPPKSAGKDPASMGPPTISAEQPRNLPSPSRRLWSFNGAADDLGGTTTRPSISRRRSRSFNGAADDLGGTTMHA